MKLMAVFIVEFGEQTDDVCLLTYRVTGMDMGLLKIRLFFQNLNAPSDLHLSEFFWDQLKIFVSGVYLTSCNFQKAVPVIEQACIGQEWAEGGNILEDVGYSTYFLGFGLICCLFEIAFTSVFWSNNPDCWISVPSTYFSHQL